MSAKPILKLDDIELPMPPEGGISISFETIWSSNAGRNTATGQMTGDIVAYKYTVSLSYDKLTENEFEILWNAVTSAKAFHTLVFPLPTAFAGRKTITCYIAPPSVQLLRWRKYRHKQTGENTYDSLSVEFIEQ